MVAIQEKGSINRGECCALLKVIEKTATRDLNTLLKKGFINKNGIGRGTRYTSI